MKIFLAVLLVFCLMPVMHLQAQDVFIKPHKSIRKQTTPIIDLKPAQPEPQRTQAAPPPPTPEKEPIAEAPAAQVPAIQQPTAQDPISEALDPQERTAVSKEMTENYYNHCLGQDNAILTEESQKLLCACTSAKMAEEMSVEEIQTMFTDTPAGQKMRNFMLLSVYTPCMKFPARDLVYKTCVEDRAVSENLKKPRAVCDCMADKMADYTVEKAPYVIAKAMQNNPGDLDPLALLFDDIHFNAHSKGVMTQCLYKEEYGWK